MKTNNKLSASNILWIVGGEEVMRYTYQEYGFGYWTSCFDVLLEKNGLLNFEKASSDALSDIENII